jgi:tetratricopeptide (TPR) repeat protein
MLHEKLEQASKDASSRRLRVTLSIFGIVLFVALAVVSVSLYQEVTDLRHELSINDSQESAPPSSKVDDKSTFSIATNQIPPSVLEENASASDSTPKTKQPIINKDELPQAPIEQEGLPPQIKFKPSSANKIREGIKSKPKPSPTADQKSKDRNSFKNALKSFEQNIEPQLNAVGFANWDAETQVDLRFLKDAAISAFSAGDYEKALALVQKVARLANDSLGEKNAAFNQALTDASHAKKADDYETAKGSIDRALQLDPESPEAQKLSSDIDALPNIIKHLRAADISRTENNLQQELESLSRVLNLDPNRKEIRDRASSLLMKIKEHAFTQHISNGLSHVQKRELKRAQANLAAARHLFPKRDEISILDTKIAKLESNLTTERFIEAAKKASAKDEWARSLQLFGKAKKIQPNNQLAVDGYALAYSITSNQQEASRHLDAPHRLSSSNVAAEVSRLIEKSRALVGNSESLDEGIDKLVDVLASYRENVPVKVMSDGLSHVSVRGVGQVGVIKEKVIQLLPGTYTFECLRAGYKTKLVRVNVAPRATRFRVEIICDERI